MSLLCRLRWHSWTKWETGAQFIETSYGLRVPMREYLSRCERCHRPRRMSKVDAG